MTRTLSARVDVIRNGAKLTELSFSDAPAIYADSAAEIKTSLKGTFKYNPLVDYFKDELVPVIIIDGVESKYGVYRIGTLSKRFTIAGLEYNNIESYDRCFLLTQNKTETILHIASGTNYITAIEQLLAAAGITQVISLPTSATLQTVREDWDVGTKYITVVNQLLTEINYDSVWFDSDGYAILKPRITPSAERIDHIYDGTTELSVLAPECSSETDIFDKPNVFIAVVSNADLSAPMMAKAENNNPLSALSTITRGIRVAAVYKVDNIASQTELQTYINNVRDSSLYSTETVSIATAIMPGHGIKDTVALNHPSIQGLFQESAWYIVMAAGQMMTHKLKRVMQ